MLDLQSWFYRGLLEAGGCHGAGADRLVASTPMAGQRDCRAGCAACCEFPVGVSSIEANGLVAWLTEHWTPEDLEELSATLAAAPPRANDRRPCVLLGADRRCRAYPARPIACRGWTSTSRAACDRGEPAADPAAFAACAGVHEALRRRGDGETHELTAALRALLSAPLRAG